LKTVVVDVPEWGGEVIVRELTADHAMALGRKVRLDDKQAMILWVIAASVDENNEPLFHDTEEDRALVGGFSAAAVLRVGNAAIKLSGLAPEEKADVTKN